MKTILLLLLMVPVYLYAQEPIKSEKKHFVNPQGKLYWQGEKPVYIFVSDNPEGKNLQRLTSEKHGQWTNPMYLDTEGVNFIRSNWAADAKMNPIVPQTELKYEMYRDSKPPVTGVEFANAPKFRNKDGKLFYGKDLSFNSGATDRHSGIQNIFYSIDGKPFQIFKNEMPLDQDKEYDVKVYAADNVGNVEPIQMFGFRVDLTPAKSTYKVHGDQSGMIFSPRTHITLASEDAASGVQKIVYKIDGGKEYTFTDKIWLAPLEDGNHSISYYAIDNVKNKEPLNKIEFYLDSTAPIADAGVVGDQFEKNGKLYVSKKSEVNLTATDNKSGVQEIKYSIDGGKNESYSRDFQLNKGKGNHMITYFASDKVNNNVSGKLNKKLSVDIDLDAPIIKNSFSGHQYYSRDTTFITSTTNIVLSAIDYESGVKEITYQVNGEAAKIYSEPFKLDKEGFYKIKFDGTDNVNNTNSKEFFFIVDNTGPEIDDVLSMAPIGNITLDEKKGNPIAVYTKGVKLFLAASDQMVDADKIYYSIDDGAELEYKTPVVLNKKGLVTYKVNAIDKLKNTNTSNLIEIFIK